MGKKKISFILQTGVKTPGFALSPQAHLGFSGHYHVTVLKEWATFLWAVVSWSFLDVPSSGWPRNRNLRWVRHQSATVPFRDRTLTPVGTYENISIFPLKKLNFLSRTEHRDQHFISSCLDDLGSVLKPKSSFMDSSAWAWVPGDTQVSQTELPLLFQPQFPRKDDLSPQKKGGKLSGIKEKWLCSCVLHLIYLNCAQDGNFRGQKTFQRLCWASALQATTETQISFEALGFITLTLKWHDLAFFFFSGIFNIHATFGVNYN